MRVYLRTTTRKHRLDVRAVSRSVRSLLRAVGEPNGSLSLSFVGDAAMRRLNREYRGQDRPTDVLSFPLDPRRDGPERLLGEVVISLTTAQRQAAEYDASLEDEVRRLLIHGVLHLLGFDHERRHERTRMRAEERRLASAIGLRWPY